MVNKHWKSVERNLCKLLGGQRTPLSGISSRHTAGDCIYTEEYTEIKHRKRFPFKKNFDEALLNAKKEGKPLLFIVKEKNQKGAVAFMTLERYLKITRTIKNNIINQIKEEALKAGNEICWEDAKDIVEKNFKCQNDKRNN